MTHPVFIRSVLFLACIGAGVTTPVPLFGQINSDAIAHTGLDVHWNVNIGGSGLAHGENSFVIWPHTTRKREFVTVRLGNRILERIDGSELDREAIDRAIQEGKRPDVLPTLHLTGAKARADKLIKKYNRLGKTPTLDEFSQPMIYIVTVTSLGYIQVVDGESGSVIWQSEVANSHIPVLGPGVSDDFVSLTNGNVLYVYDLATGDLLNTRKVPYTPTGASQPFHGKIVVPCVGGRLLAFDARTPTNEPIILRTGTENQIGTILSLDEEFVAWTSKSQFILAKNGKTPSLWSSVRVYNQIFPSRPIPTPEGYVVVASNGSLFRVRASDRTDSVMWRKNLGKETSVAPIVGSEMVLILSDDDELYAMNIHDGEDLWGRSASNITGVLGIGREHIYARHTSGGLVVIDSKTGAETVQASVQLIDIIPNSVNDRFFTCTKLGALTCMREIDAKLPTMVNRQSSSKPPEATDSSRPKSTTPPTDDADSLFGDTPADMSSSDDDTEPEDPFANPQ